MDPSQPSPSQPQTPASSPTPAPTSTPLSSSSLPSTPATEHQNQPTEKAALAPSNTTTSTNITPTNPTHTTKSISKNTKPIYTSWQFWAVIILALVGVIGWVFAVVELGNHMAAQDKVNTLEAEIAEKNRLIVLYGTELGYEVDQYGRPTGKPSTPTDDDQIQVASSDYIYVGEWGIKIKIPKDIKSVSYIFDNMETPKATMVTEEPISYQNLCVWAVPEAATYSPAFAQYDTNASSLGCIAQYAEEPNEVGSPGKTVFKDADHVYRYYHPQSVSSIDEQEQQWELEAVNAIENMFTSDISAFTATDITNIKYESSANTNK